MDKVVHFEIPCDDMGKAEKFYQEVFGWQIQPMPEMRYTIIRTVAVDEKHMPKESGAINGGMDIRDKTTAQTPVIVIDVANINDSIKKIVKHGGSLFRMKTSVGEMGWYAQVKDNQNNIIGLWETVKE